MIIGLSGYAQSGKDTVAGMLIGLHKYEKVAFADTIRNLLYEMDPFVTDGELSFRLQDVVDTYGWENAKKVAPEIRRLLQELGVGGRHLFGLNFWVNQALNPHIYEHPAVGVNKNIVVTDVRFINEAETVKSLGGQIWRINRPGVGPVNNHVSETNLDDWNFDAVINNNGGMEHLIAQIKELLG